MSHLDKFLNYLLEINESTGQLTKEDYQKICVIRDRVTDLAAKISVQKGQIKKPVTIKERDRALVHQPINETIIPLGKYFKSI